MHVQRPTVEVILFSWSDADGGRILEHRTLFEEMASYSSRSLSRFSPEKEDNDM